MDRNKSKAKPKAQHFVFSYICGAVLSVLLLTILSLTLMWFGLCISILIMSSLLCHVSRICILQTSTRMRIQLPLSFCNQSISEAVCGDVYDLFSGNRNLILQLVSFPTLLPGLCRGREIIPELFIIKCLSKTNLIVIMNAIFHIHM